MPVEMLFGRACCMNWMNWGVMMGTLRLTATSERNTSPETKKSPSSRASGFAGGGAFLLWKSTAEVHQLLEGEPKKRGQHTLGGDGEDLVTHGMAVPGVDVVQAIEVEVHHHEVASGGQGEIGIRCKNGRTIPARAVLTPARNRRGGVYGFVAVFDDISDVKRAEAELAERNIELQALSLASRALPSQRRRRHVQP